MPFFPRGELLYDLIQFITGVFIKTVCLSYVSTKFSSRALPNNFTFNADFARLGEQIFNLHLYELGKVVLTTRRVLPSSE